MSKETKTTEPVKQEGDFKLKKKRVPKKLTVPEETVKIDLAAVKKADEPIKVDLTKTENKDAVQEQKTEESVLREEGSKMGLQEVGQTHEETTENVIEEIPVTGLIYVTTTPEKSKERVDLRARAGESIPLSYLQRCHNYHESWIKNINKQVCLFNGNVDFKDKLDYLSKDLVTGFIIRHVSPQNNPHMYTMCSC